MHIRPHQDIMAPIWFPLRAILAAAAILTTSSARELAAETPRLIKYEFEATITDLNDPLNLFPSVGLGDAATGTITYDPLKSDDLSDPNANFYTNPEWFESATLVIHDSSGVDMAFLPDFHGGFPFNAWMINDLEDEETFEATDGISFIQTVIAPDGFAGVAAGLSVDFLAPSTQFDSLEDTLPDELILDEWPFVAVAFLDLFLVDESATYLEATIHTLRAVDVVPGNFDGRGGVDAADLSIWQEEFGIAPDGDPFSYLPYADADGDGDSDGNDFLFWQRNLGGGAVAMTIPEPRSILLSIALAAMMGIDRWRCRTTA